VAARHDRRQAPLKAQAVDVLRGKALAEEQYQLQVGEVMLGIVTEPLAPDPSLPEPIVQLGLEIGVARNDVS
jgi:hypothetical protein